MVFPIVSAHIRKNNKSTKYRRPHIAAPSACNLSTALFSLLCLCACSAQEGASAQSNQTSASPSKKNLKILKDASSSLDAGREIFERANCAMCHPGGNNTMAPKHPIKGPNFVHKYSEDALLESTIRKGFPDMGMPSFSKKQIDDREMKDLIAYVRSLNAPLNLSPHVPKSSALK